MSKSPDRKRFEQYFDSVGAWIPGEGVLLVEPDHKKAETEAFRRVAMWLQVVRGQNKYWKPSHRLTLTAADSFATTALLAALRAEVSRLRALLASQHQEILHPTPKIL